VPYNGVNTVIKMWKYNHSCFFSVYFCIQSVVELKRWLVTCLHTTCSMDTSYIRRMYLWLEAYSWSTDTSHFSCQRDGRQKTSYKNGCHAQKGNGL